MYQIHIIFRKLPHLPRLWTHTQENKLFMFQLKAANSVQNDSIMLSIIYDQPESLLNYLSNNGRNLYYEVQWKGHFENSWQSYQAESAYTYINAIGAYSYADTTIFFGFAGDNGSTTYNSTLDAVPNGGKIDFQVQAILGDYTNVPYYPPGDTSIPMGRTDVFNAITNSGWSNTQTISIPDGSVSNSTSPNPTTSPTPTTTPTVPEFPFIAIPMLLSLLSVAVIVNLRKKRIGEK